MLFLLVPAALSSTSAVTASPFCARPGERRDDRGVPAGAITGCLMAGPADRRPARSMKSTTHTNESYGSAPKTFLARESAKHRPAQCANGGATRGTSGSSLNAETLRSGARAMRAVTYNGRGTRLDVARPRGRALPSRSTEEGLVGVDARISRRKGAIAARCPQALLDHSEKRILRVLFFM